MEKFNDDGFDKRAKPSFLVAREPSIDRRFRPCPERKVRLFEDIREDCDADDSSVEDESTPTFELTESEASTNSNGGHGAMVYLRMRPVEAPSKAYMISETGSVLITCPTGEVAGTSNNNNNKQLMEKHYSFSAIFGGEVEQREVYEKCIGQKIEMEESFTVLTYGTSGSGKTFTLLGSDGKPGIIPRAIENIFTLYKDNIYPQPIVKLVNANVTILDDDSMAKEISIRRQLFGTCEDVPLEHVQLQKAIQDDHNFQTVPLTEVSVFIWISFVEIYNELVYDLLAPPERAVKPSIVLPQRKALKIVGNDGKVFTKGLRSVLARNSLEALQLMHYGLQHVNYASTSINENSSRSHCIFIIEVLKYFQSGEITETSYKFCDLAGSERLHKTRNVGSRLTEAKRINTSLMVLGRCLDAANNSRKQNKDIIPYRESKLTTLLQSALLGKERLSMIVNVMPTDAFYEENMNVLTFSSIAKNIIFKQPVIKHNRSRYSFLGEQKNMSFAAKERLQLLEEVVFLRSEVDRLTSDLQNQLIDQEVQIRNELVESFKKTLARNKEQHELDLKQELEIQEHSYMSQIAELKRKYEAEIEDLREELEEQREEFEKENLSKSNKVETSKKRRTLDT